MCSMTCDSPVGEFDTFKQKVRERLNFDSTLRQQAICGLFGGY